jgi:CRP-like cAMP-binding protein
MFRPQHMRYPEKKAEGSPPRGIRRSMAGDDAPARDLGPPRLAFVKPACEGGALRAELPFYAEAYEGGPGPTGLLLRATDRLPVGREVRVFIHDFPRWRGFKGQVRWSRPDAQRAGYRFFGCTAVYVDDDQPQAPACGDARGPYPADLEFFQRLPFFSGLRREAICPFLNCVRRRALRAGDRFILQGEEGDVCYIVQRGVCRIVLEKNGELRPVGIIGEQEFVGEMALLTGEPRSAHAEAQTDMVLWGIPRDEFEALIQVDPEVAAFLTEIVAERFAGRKITADRRIGDFVITDVVGKGAFAIVYKGHPVGRQQPVAIKMLRHDIAMQPEFIASFRREASLIAALKHENIVRVLGVEERFRTVFIIMEWLEGRTLRGLLDDARRLSAREAASILTQVCRALAHAHGRAVIHQDVNPANIFLLPDGKVKLLDFGMAGPCGSPGRMTGTPHYMAPEQVQCLPVDERTDVYALGVTAFEMVCGRRPFEEGNAFKVMSAQVERDIPDPGRVVPGLCPILRDFILKACRRDPEERPPGATRLLELLEQPSALPL